MRRYLKYITATVAFGALLASAPLSIAQQSQSTPPAQPGQGMQGGSGMMGGGMMQGGSGMMGGDMKQMMENCQKMMGGNMSGMSGSGSSGSGTSPEMKAMMEHCHSMMQQPAGSSPTAPAPEKKS